MFKREKTLYKRPLIEVSECGAECKWFFKSKPGFSCRAFDLIPREIIDGEVEHDVIIKGEKGICTFKSKKQ